MEPRSLFNLRQSITLMQCPLVYSNLGKFTFYLSALSSWNGVCSLFFIFRISATPALHSPLLISTVVLTDLFSCIYSFISSNSVLNICNCIKQFQRIGPMKILCRTKSNLFTLKIILIMSSNTKQTIRKGFKKVLREQMNPSI